MNVNPVNTSFEGSKIPALHKMTEESSFSRSARVYAGGRSYGGIVRPLDGLSNRDEVPNNELRLRRVDANADQRLPETACQTSVAGSRSTHHFDNALPHRCCLGTVRLLADQLSCKFVRKAHNNGPRWSVTILCKSHHYVRKPLA